MQLILFMHRYLAVAVGLLMTLWCLSGFVMMYQGFPALSSETRLNGLQALDLSECCELADFAPHDDTPLGDFSIEMLLGEPVLRVSARDGVRTINLRSGETMATLDEAAVLEVAREFAEGNELQGTPRSLGIIDIDQWTLQAARRNAPAWHVALGDPAATEIYINGSSGEVFQRSNRRERILSWFGAIPHWLYPTVLRQNGPLWTELVIWTSVLGTFLAATGLYVGIKRLRRNSRRNGNKLGSPYVGWWYWHHISGLVFGVLVLTWVFSGLMTMNPWGALSSGGGVDYRAQVTGTARWSELRQFLRTIDSAGHAFDDGQVKQLTPAVFNHELFLLVQTGSGENFRLDSNAQRAPLDTSAIEQVVSGLNTASREAGLLHREDNYYYGHKREVALPVYRAIMDDSEKTRLYINTETGALRSVDSTGRWSRWIRTGLHDLDFPLLRLRPLWDVVVILLLLGVTLVCATGTWMALRRIRHDYLSLKS